MRHPTRAEKNTTNGTAQLELKKLAIANLISNDAITLNVSTHSV